MTVGRRAKMRGALASRCSVTAACFMAFDRMALLKE
jgi:hypothetical protein